MNNSMKYDGEYFAAEVSSVDEKFRLYSLEGYEIMQVSQGSVRSSYSYGYACAYVDKAIKELEEIKERLQ